MRIQEGKMEKSHISGINILEFNAKLISEVLTFVLVAIGSWYLIFLNNQKYAALFLIIGLGVALYGRQIIEVFCR